MHLLPLSNTPGEPNTTDGTTFTENISIEPSNDHENQYPSNKQD